MTRLIDRFAICLFLATTLAWTVRSATGKDEPAPDKTPHKNNAKAPDADDDKKPEKKGISDDQIEKVMAYLEKQQPDMHEKLVRLRKQNPNQFTQLINNQAIQKKYRYWLQDPVAAELDDQLADLRRSIYDVAKKVQSADNPEESPHAKALQDLLTEEHELRLKLREHQLKKLEDRIAGLKKELQQQRNGKDRYIQDRLERLSQGPDGSNSDKNSNPTVTNTKSPPKSGGKK